MQPVFKAPNPGIARNYLNTFVSLTSHNPKENDMNTRHHSNVPACRELRGQDPLTRWQMVTTMCLILLMLFGGGLGVFGNTTLSNAAIIIDVGGGGENPPPDGGGGGGGPEVSPNRPYLSNIGNHNATTLLSFDWEDKSQVEDGNVLANTHHNRPEHVQ